MGKYQTKREAKKVILSCVKVSKNCPVMTVPQVGGRLPRERRGTRFRRGNPGRFRPDGDAAILRCGIAIPPKNVYT